VGEVGGRWGEPHLGIGGNLDLPHPKALVGERHPADLAVVLGETTTSSRLPSDRSRRTISTRSSAKIASYRSGSVPLGCNPADQTSPLSVSRK